MKTFAILLALAVCLYTPATHATALEGKAKADQECSMVARLMRGCGGGPRQGGCGCPGPLLSPTERKRRQEACRARHACTGMPEDIVSPEIISREVDVCRDCIVSLPIISKVITSMHDEVIPPFADEMCSVTDRCTRDDYGGWYAPEDIVRCAVMGQQCEITDESVFQRAFNLAQVRLQMTANRVMPPIVAKWCKGLDQGSPFGMSICRQYIFDRNHVVMQYAAVGRVDVNYCFDIGICRSMDVDNGPIGVGGTEYPEAHPN